MSPLTKRFKYILITVFLIYTGSLSAQESFTKDVYTPLYSWVFSIEGGFTLAYTDYLKTRPAGSMRGSVEYYFPAMDNSIFGLKLYGGGQKLSGKDDRPLIDTETGKKELMPVFVTDVILLGFGGSYSYSIDNQIFPFIQLGLAYLWFSPKDENGTPTIDNTSNVYKKTTFEFNAELGVKFSLSKKVSISLLGGAHFPSSDFLDDIAAGKNNDVYYTGMVGVSFSPFVPVDSDGDGIFDDKDMCPDEPEDVDGFEDWDGCPDLDNDRDGVPDVQDLCPDEPEDIDGFHDNDGCPDTDNDLDGIPDIKDKCPNEAEDFDGFLDEDGCPELDNDKDGIADLDDMCPNQAENFNGFQDEDGCPDQLKIASIKVINYQGEEIFYERSAKIRPEGAQKLNEALEIMNIVPDSKWRIEGHMDSQGTEQFIRKMSFERAEAVKDYFIEHGIAPERLTIYGMSDDFPVGNNNTDEGRKMNRRIVIVREN